MKYEEIRDRLSLFRMIMSDAVEYYSTKEEVSEVAETSARIIGASSLVINWNEESSWNGIYYRLTIELAFDSVKVPMNFDWWE